MSSSNSTLAAQGAGAKRPSIAGARRSRRGRRALVIAICGGVLSLALGLALYGMRDTIVFFLELQASAEKYDDSREQIKKLVDEERKHLARLAKMLQKVLA